MIHLVLFHKSIFNGTNSAQTNPAEGCTVEEGELGSMSGVWITQEGDHVRPRDRGRRFIPESNISEIVMMDEQPAVPADKGKGKGARGSRASA